MNPTDFRSISCCTVLYKSISKLLCNWLKNVLPGLVNPSQGAFVQCREMLYDVLLSQELARGYNRKNISPRCIMKIDLKKAYDSVHWEFLKELLEALRFPTMFITWIMACVTTTHYTITLNGGDFGHFKGGRGLRQGNPISPSYLYL